MSDGMELTAPAEGEASTPASIADELAAAVGQVEHVDYNALLEEDLRALLDAKATLAELCQKHREMQHTRERRDD